MKSKRWQLPPLAIDDTRGIANAYIEDCQRAGIIRCRLCGRFERMAVYAARYGPQVHYFGLHHQCARAYLARLKIFDGGTLTEIDYMFLYPLTGASPAPFDATALYG